MSLFGASLKADYLSVFMLLLSGRVHKLLLILPAFVLFDDAKETYRELGV